MLVRLKLFFIPYSIFHSLKKSFYPPEQIQLFSQRNKTLFEGDENKIFIISDENKRNCLPPLY